MYVYVCVYVSIYIYIYVSIYIHTYTYMYNDNHKRLDDAKSQLEPKERAVTKPIPRLCPGPRKS